MTDTMTPDTYTGYPDGRYPDRRRIGQFNWLQISGFTVVPEDQLTSRVYDGMFHTDTWVNGFFHGADGAFSVYSHNLRTSPDGVMRPGMFSAGGSTAGPDGMVPEPRPGVDTGVTSAVQELVDGHLVYRITGSTGSEEVRFDGAALDWASANGRLRVTGPRCGQGAQWHHAWRRPDDATGEMLYCQHAYDVAGEYLGEPVHGLVLVETIFGDEQHYTDSWFTRCRVGNWGMFGNVYDDGTSEYGQFLRGEYGATGAVVVDDHGRETLNTVNVRVVERDGADLRYEFGDGEAWDFTADPRTIQQFGPPGEGTVLVFGSCRRADETRTVVRSTATYLTAGRIPRTDQFT